MGLWHFGADSKGGRVSTGSEHQPKTVPMPLEPQGFVEGMGLRPFKIGGNDDFVAASLPTAIDGVGHHGPANPWPWTNGSTATSSTTPEQVPRWPRLSITSNANVPMILPSVTATYTW